MTLIEQSERVAQFALSLPCDLIHKKGLECAICNPRIVHGYCASPAFLAIRLSVAHQILTA